MKLEHQHDTGGECLACDVALWRMVLASSMLKYEDDRATLLKAADRIEAALVEREHSEKLYEMVALAKERKNSPDWQRQVDITRRLYAAHDTWEVERARKGTKG